MKLLTYSEFMNEYKKYYDKIFSGNHVDEGCFRDPDWQQVLLEGHRIRDFDKIIFSALKNVIIAVEGQKDVIMTEVETPHAETVTVPFSMEELDAAWFNYSFAYLDSVVFGRSGAWGIFLAYDDFSCIGGDDLFMSKFLGCVDGGKERLKNDFLEYIKGDWFSDLSMDRALKRVGWE